MVNFCGVYPALVTPKDASGGINLPVLEQLVEYLIGKGVDGFYIGGTTGEGIFMSVPERQQLAEAVLLRTTGRVPVIVHVGAVAINDALELARHAARHGASGFASIMPPLYNSAPSVIAYYKTLAAAAPDLPFFSYIFNPHIDPVIVMRGLMAVSNLVGIKYTGSNMYEMRTIMDMNDGRWITFSGMDEQCVYAAMMGVHGCIGSTLNFMPGVYRAIHEAVAHNDHQTAQSLQLRTNRVTSAMMVTDFTGALRAVLAMIGFDCGQPRLPALPLTAEQETALRQALEATDFKELVAM